MDCSVWYDMNCFGRYDMDCSVRMTCLQEAKKSMTFEKTEKIPLTKKGVSVFLQVLL